MDLEIGVLGVEGRGLEGDDGVEGVVQGSRVGLGLNLHMIGDTMLFSPRSLIR